MTRTLPWLKAQGQPSATKPRAVAPKRQRLLDPDSEDDALPRVSGLTSPRRKALARPNRSPSTSPPPEPPLEEFMHEGLDRDDIYIMVEDEFQAVSKRFTQHLHHAEYVRLKNVAKARNASTITTISRPTDSITAMREETKRRRYHEAKATKQKSALEQLKARAAAKRPKTGSEEESEEDVAREDTPWAGTMLQGLMTSPSSSRQQMSLTGLQGVMSSTRAAAGFSKPQAPTSRPRAFDMGPDLLVQKQVVRASATAEDDATASDDDDLDAPVPQVRHEARSSHITTARPKSVAKGTISTTAQKPPLLSSPLQPPLRTTLSRPNQTLSKSNQSSQRIKSRVSSDIFDGFPLPRSDVSARMMKRRAEMNARKGKETETKPSLDEIPIFLV
ncbi:hypothetical protein MMC30_007825 [Trapelia coarctata]|nr:hypothetical protein [Trapelia coarctata]